MHIINISPCRLMLLLAVFSLTAGLFAQFSGGSGTADDPYLVSTPDDLNSVRDHLNSYFLQVADIDLDITPYNNGWTQIGYFYAEYNPGNIPFTGTYNGNGYAISNLFVTGNNRGFFRLTEYANLKNINLTDCNVDAVYNYVGALVSEAYDTNIINCHISGSVSALNMVGMLSGFVLNSSVTGCSSNGSLTSDCNPSGGLIGKAENSAISDCYADVIVSGSLQCGGFAGYLDNSTVNACWSDSQVTGSSTYVGGFAGQVYYSDCHNCYATGNVSGYSYVGGFCATIYSGTVSCCYSTGNVSGTLRGGFVFSITGETTVSNCYWNTETSGVQTSAAGTGLTTDQMTFPYPGQVYIDWDFYTIWHHDMYYAVNNGLPYLRIVTDIDYAEAPSIVPPTGIYYLPLPVTMHTNTPGATIRYTLDGTDPTLSSRQYTEPFMVYLNNSDQVIVKARTFKAGMFPSETVTVTYTYPIGNEDETDAVPFIASCHISPNPFSHNTTIQYSLPKRNDIKLTIYNAKGQLIKTLSEGTYAKGQHTVTWDGTSDNGSPVKGGIYFIRLHGSDIRLVRKLVLLK